MDLKQEIQVKIVTVKELAKIKKDEIESLERQLSRLEQQLEDEDREVPSRLWECRYTECDYGMGLAGRDSCPGNPRDINCEDFTTKWSNHE